MATAGRLLYQKHAAQATGKPAVRLHDCAASRLAEPRWNLLLGCERRECYNLSMETAVTRSVAQFDLEERCALEGILGGPLASNQHVLIMAYTPGEPPDEGIREQAMRRLEQTLARNEAIALSMGVTPAEADNAVAEAMNAIRRRE